MSNYSKQILRNVNLETMAPAWPSFLAGLFLIFSASTHMYPVFLCSCSIPSSPAFLFLYFSYLLFLFFCLLLIARLLLFHLSSFILVEQRVQLGYSVMSVMGIAFPSLESQIKMPPPLSSFIQKQMFSGT